MALGNNPGGGTLGGTTTLMTNASGLATFNDLTVSAVGTGFTLVASSAGLTMATSKAFDQAGVATQLIFVQQPTSGGAAGVLSPPVTVDVLDQFGNPFSGSYSVTVALGNNPGNADLGGTLTQTTGSSPQVAFDDLTLHQPGMGYTLVATLTSPTSLTATSAAFDQAPTGVVSGTVFDDLNGDGVREPNEPGLQGFVIQLTLVTNGTPASATTDADGNYQFTSLPPGTYQAVEVQQAQRRMTAPAGGNYQVPVLSGQTVSMLDFGNLDSASKSYVYQAYLDLLGRPVDPQGLNYWSSRVDGLAQEQFVADIQASPISPARGRADVPAVPAARVGPGGPAVVGGVPRQRRHAAADAGRFRGVARVLRETGRRDE